MKRGEIMKARKNSSNIETPTPRFSTKTSQGRHWVGDGFLVHSMLSPNDTDFKKTSPLLLLDYAAPHIFPANPITEDQPPRGVGPHPHRGFETVTLAYQGEVEHHDSSGGGGVILEGDVQWMTAGKGVIHSEYHSRDFSQTEGCFEMIQLWINLPMKAKMTKPRYQLLKNDDIPRVALPNSTDADSHAEARLITCRIGGVLGLAKTHSSLNLYDIKTSSSGSFILPEKASFNRIIFSLDADIYIGASKLPSKSIAVFDEGASEKVEVTAPKGARLLVVEGEPIDEPVVWHGPFVMNTKEEIVQAISDYQSGRMG